MKRIGGIWFWRVWRIGGSFYIAKRRRAVPATPVNDNINSYYDIKRRLAAALRNARPVDSSYWT